MSTTKTATSYKLSLGVENGVNALGAAQVKSVSVGSVKLDAADDKCLAVANAMNELDRKSTRLNSSHVSESRMPSSA